jgi:hypothetical protein
VFECFQAPGKPAVLVSEKPVSTKTQTIDSDDLAPVFDSLSPEDVGDDPLLGYEDDGFVVVKAATMS